MICLKHRISDRSFRQYAFLYQRLRLLFAQSKSVIAFSPDVNGTPYSACVVYESDNVTYSSVLTLPSFLRTLHQLLTATASWNAAALGGLKSASVCRSRARDPYPHLQYSTKESKNHFFVRVAPYQDFVIITVIDLPSRFALALS